MREVIRFTDEEIQTVEDFAEKIKWKHPHFKDKRNVSNRTQEQVKTDVILGKLAEVGVEKYLLKYFKENVSGLDFNIYEKGIADDCDIKVADKVISIKSSKMGSSILMVEKEKFQLDENNKLISIEQKPLPDYFIFVRVSVEEGNIFAEIGGGISCSDFWKRRKYMPRGMILNRENAKMYFMERKHLNELDWNGRGSKLLADNYGIHINMLYDFTKICVL